MSAKISVEKQVTAVRHFVRRGDETLWFGQVASDWTLSERGAPVTHPLIFVFAINVHEAATKIVCVSASRCDAKYSNFRMHRSPEEVTLSAE